MSSPCDIREPESVAAAFDAVESELGPIDVLVNNAAGNFPVPAEDMSPNAWRTVVDIVLNGTFFCCRDLARRLIPADRDGAIVNVGASYAWTGGPGFAHSAAAKAGVKNLTETLAVEWAPYGIRVNGLVPGLMPHEDETAAIAAVPGKYEGQDSRVPAGRVGLPAGAGLGRHLSLLPVRHLHQRPFTGGGRGQLATTPHRATAIHAHPGTARPTPLRSREFATPPCRTLGPDRSADGTRWVSDVGDGTCWHHHYE